MIISASRRTDIPARYMPWMERRLAAGYADVPNPFNPRQVSRVDLRLEAVAALVLWTRNPEPALAAMERIAGRGYPFVLLLTVTGYPQVLEPAAPPLAQTLAAIGETARRFGPERIAWRYDPILFSSLTPPEWHVGNFERLLAGLHGSVGRIIISFADFYPKVIRSLAAVTAASGIAFTDPHEQPETARELTAALVRIAAERGLTVRSCAEKLDLEGAGAAPGACIDARWLSEVTGRAIDVPTDPHQRAACRCASSRDIGMYHCCPQGCVYCYANSSAAAAAANYLRHDPDSPQLLPAAGQRNIS